MALELELEVELEVSTVGCSAPPSAIDSHVKHFGRLLPVNVTPRSQR